MFKYYIYIHGGSIVCSSNWSIRVTHSPWDIEGANLSISATNIVWCLVGYSCWGFNIRWNTNNIIAWNASCGWGSCFWLVGKWVDRSVGLFVICTRELVDISVVVSLGVYWHKNAYSWVGLLVFILVGGLVSCLYVSLFCFIMLTQLRRIIVDDWSLIGYTCCISN